MNVYYTFKFSIGAWLKYNSLRNIKRCMEFNEYHSKSKQRFVTNKSLGLGGGDIDKD